MNRSDMRAAREILRVRDSLRMLDRALSQLTPLLIVKLSARTQAARVLQGRYMGYMRQLKPRQKAQARKIRLVKGVRAAIARAREMART
ncbi:MAG: hypothetical protein ACREIH_04555 [Nitrospiraceae bacterium]